MGAVAVGEEMLDRRQVLAATAAAMLIGSACSAGSPDALTVDLFAAAAGAAIPAHVTLVRTGGYGTPGEGAATYIHDPNIDDDYLRRYPASTFAAADGRLFRLQTGLAINAVALGLRTGLGRDFAQQNRRAIDEALRLGDKLSLPAGDIDLTGTGSIGLPERDGIVIAGQGWTSRLVTSDSAFTLPNVSRLEIRDLWIEQVATGNAAIQSFHTNLRDVRLLRLKITMRDQGLCQNNCIGLVMDRSPVGADGLVGLDGLLVEDCWLAPGRMGIEIQNHRADDDRRKLYCYRNIIVRGCTFWKAPAFAGMGVSLSGWGDNCTIANNRFVACHGPNVEIVGSDRTTVRDNVFEDAIGSPITASNYRVVSGCRIQGNRTIGKPPTVALYLEAVDGGEVSGNALSTRGTIIIKGRDMRLHDNEFIGVGTTGILQLDNARSVVVERNRFLSLGTVDADRAMIIAFNNTRDCMIRWNRMERADYDVNRSDRWFFQAPPARGTVVYGNERRGRGQRLVEPNRP